MKLSQREFNAMNNPIRRGLQRMVEYPNFKRMGLKTTGLDVLEIGCTRVEVVQPQSVPREAILEILPRHQHRRYQDETRPPGPLRPHVRPLRVTVPRE